METTRIDDISANQIRAKLASLLAATCPAHLGAGIAITGSVARGVADHYSDVNLNFWVDQFEPAEVYIEWLRSVGAVVDDLHIKEGQWVAAKSQYRGLLFVMTWATWDSLENFVQQVLAGETTDHWTLTNVWHVAEAVPLREHPELTDMRAILRQYPDTLQHAVITSVINRWAQPHDTALNLWALAHRGVRLALITQLTHEIEQVLRILWALNRRWEIEWKWLEPESKKLTTKPMKLIEQVNAIYSTPDAHESVRLCLQLILETLELLPTQFDASIQLARIRAALDPEGLL